MKKFVLGFIVALVLCSIVIGAFMVINKEKSLLNDQKIKDNEIINEENNEETSLVDISKQEKNFAQEIVYTARRESFEEHVHENNYIKWSTVMPQIKSEDEIFKKINEQIQEIYNEAKEDKTTNSFISYEAYLNNDILSLVIRKDSVDFGGTIYYVYNVNIKNKEIVKREEILNLKGITEVELNEKANEVIAELREQYKGERDFFAIREAYSNDFGYYNNEIYLDNNGNINILIGSGEAGTDAVEDVYYPIKLEDNDNEIINNDNNVNNQNKKFWNYEHPAYLNEAFGAIESTEIIENTFYSIYENKNDEEIIDTVTWKMYSHLNTGDGAAGSHIDCNYENFQKEAIKITKPIEFKLSDLHESVSRDVSDLVLNGEDSYSYVNAIENGDTEYLEYAKRVIEKATKDEKLKEFNFKEHDDIYEDINLMTYINGVYGHDYMNYYLMNSERENMFFQINGFLIMNGNNTTKEDWKNNARAKKIKVIIGDNEYIYDLKDDYQVQFFNLLYNQDDISKPVDIKIEVIEIYNGDVTNDVYLSDIAFEFYSPISGAR